MARPLRTAFCPAFVSAHSAVVRRSFAQPLAVQIQKCRDAHTHTRHSRAESTLAYPPTSPPSAPALALAPAETGADTTLQRLPLRALLRNILMGMLFTSPRLLKHTVPAMAAIAHSRGALLSPERNGVLRAALRASVYEQFCAGASDAEIARTRAGVKRLGFSGVVLCFGRESQVGRGEGGVLLTGGRVGDEIRYWREGTLETVDMAREGDWVGIKFTGAGAETMDALMAGKALPAAFDEAMTAICERAQAKGCKIWIDAEQQAVQAGIDAATIALMRRFNRGGRVLVYNTLQAYLKSSREKLKHQLALSHAEGWTLAVKLVRGAYIANDTRGAIHDSKADTDASYDGIIRDVLAGTNLGFEPASFPSMQLLVAGHNPESVLGAFALMRRLQSEGRLAVRPDFAQLQGMADVLGCELLRQCEGLRSEVGSADTAGMVPKVYKCLTWGTVQECIQYLLRRMVENGSASDRIRDGLAAYVAELRRRVLG